jgi:hypothetical protein
MKWLAVVVGWMALCAPAHAQTPAQVLEMKRAVISSMVGTLYTKAAPNFAGGKLNGCTIEYGAIIRDFKYSRGELVLVGGSFGVLGSSSQIGAFLKVVFQDYDPRTMEPRPNAPEEAAFVFGNATNQSNALKTAKSDVPGGLFVVFPPFPTLEQLFEQIERGEVTIAVARKRGESAIVIPIDITVEETLPDKNNQKKRSKRTWLEYMGCSEQYLKNMEALAR